MGRTGSASVKVQAGFVFTLIDLSPGEAGQQAVAALNDALATCTGSQCTLVASALAKLDGNGGGQNGYLDKLAVGDMVAALTKLLQVMRDLEDLTASGMDMSALMSDLMTAAFTTVQSFLYATAAVPCADGALVSLAFSDLNKATTLWPSKGDWDGAIKALRRAYANADNAVPGPGSDPAVCP